MGISLVCGMGPGVPDHFHGIGGPLFRQTPAHADHAGMVYETRRPDTGLRMELQRREPARAGLGRHGSLPAGERADRQRRYRIPEKDLPEAADQFYLVDQP